MSKPTIDTIRGLLEDSKHTCGPATHGRLDKAIELLNEIAPPETPADPIQALRVALDYGIEREWPADLRELVARLLPEMQIATRWTGEGGDSIHSRWCATTGRLVVQVRQGMGNEWHISHPIHSMMRATLEIAQHAADAYASEEGWTLGGGAVVVLDATASAEVGEQISGTEARVEIRHESEWGQSTPPPVWPVPARPAVDEEPQPDASWLRLVEATHQPPIHERATLPLWIYTGHPPLRDVSITGANAAEVLRGWLQTRGLLHRFTEPVFGTPYEIVTRAPLDGDWCAECGNNMDLPSFLASRIRLVDGEEARVCAGCVEGSDNQPDGSEGMWP